jgi:MFS family permease
MWRHGTLAILFFCNVLSFIDRATFNQLLVRIKADMRLSDVNVGLLGGTAFSLAFMFVTIPASVLIDSVLPSRKRFLFVAVLMWSLFSASSCVSRFGFMFVCRMGVGLGEAVLSPTAYGLIGDLYPPERRGFALGVYVTASFVGVGLSFFIASAVLSQTGLAPFHLHPWQFCFLVLGAVGFCFSFVLCWIREPPRDVAAMPKIEEMFGVLLGEKRRFFLPFYLSVFFFALCMSSWSVFVMIFFKNLHVPEAQAALILGVVESCLGLLGCVAGGLLNDLLEMRSTKVGSMVSFAVLLLLVMHAVFSVSRALTSGIFLSFWLSGGVFLLEGALFTMLASMLQSKSSPNTRSFVSGVYMAVIAGGVVSGPLLTGMFSDTFFENRIGDALLLTTSCSMIPAIISMSVVVYRGNVSVRDGDGARTAGDSADSDVVDVTK